VHLVTTRRVRQRELGAIDAREVQATTRLRLVHGQAERPRVERRRVQGGIREVLRVHFVREVVMERLGHVFKERDTIDVHARFIERVHRVPRTSRRISRNQVNRLGRVVKVGKINFSISVRRQLILRLRDQKFVLVVSDKLAFITVKVRVHTIHLRRFGRRKVIAALDSDFDFVVLQTHEREALGPIFTEEERNQVVIGGTFDTLRVILDFSRRDGRGRAGLVFLIDDVVYTLNVQRIETCDLLATDVQEELGRLSGIGGEQTVGIRRDVGDILRFDPHVSKHITLGTNRNGDFIVRTESADVIHALRLNRKIRVTPVVLTEKADLRLTSDEHILGALRDKINQGC